MKSSRPLLRAAGTPGKGQLLTGPRADPQYKYSTPMPLGIASPDTVDTRFGVIPTRDKATIGAIPTQNGYAWSWFGKDRHRPVRSVALQAQ